ncbi:hypothetical protein GH5_06530 [Leishmania sp. Ghana 2012 LV757]|uniref:hypothetical protein n=1 Tax=Leishmania sp. Ghana 2012 LV757 TaxID=2803181 RepID=UPI001B568858|nr:hypothetical protein GH5_06530 [Leishmania sp. Ghana 2012 LV757]
MIRFVRISFSLFLSAQSPKVAAAAATQTHIAAEYFLMDKVCWIQLEVALQPETDEAGSLLSAAVVGRASVFSTGNQQMRSTSSLTVRLSSTVAARASAVFWRHVLKDITVHPGVLVDAQLPVYAHVWSPGVSRISWAPHLMPVLLSLLSMLQMALGVRTLQRIAQY